MNRLLEALKAAQRSVELAEEALEMLDEGDSVSPNANNCNPFTGCNQSEDCSRFPGCNPFMGGILPKESGEDCCDMTVCDLVNIVGVVLDIWQASVSAGNRQLSDLCVTSLSQFVRSTVE